MREDASTFEFESQLSLVDMSQVRVLLSVLNVRVLGSSPRGVTKKLGQRRSWRGGTDCNNRVNCHKSLIGNRLEVSGYHTPLQSQSVAVRLSRFDPYLTHNKAFQVGVYYKIVS